ncbi:MAG: hypothetical protein WC373_02400 [Smithella sp.]
MRARSILFLSLFVPFTLIFAYIWATAADLVISDDIFLIKGGFIESYLSGSLTFDDLWRPLNLGRNLGYNLLQLANIKFFSLNAKLMVLLVPFFMLVSAALIYREYRKSLKPKSSPEFIAATFFILTLMIFNIIQWEGLICSSVLAFQSAMPFFIASFLILELLLFNGQWKYLPAALILTALAMLVFNGRLNLSFLPTLGVIFFCYLLTQRSRLTKYFWLRAFFISVFLTATVFIYIYRIHLYEYSSASSLSTEIFVRPREAVDFLLAAFGSSVLGIDVFYNCTYLSFDNILLLGLMLVLLYFLALILFFKSRMYERTYLPLFLIMQTFFYLGFMMIGRFEFGKDYGMSSRYTGISIYGLVAIVWIFIFILTKPAKTNALLKGTIFTGLAIIFSGLIMTSIIEWRIQPERKAYMERLNDIAMRVDTATEEELLKIGDEPKQVRDSLRILRKHRLNIYHNLSVDDE